MKWEEGIRSDDTTVSRRQSEYGNDSTPVHSFYRDSRQVFGVRYKPEQETETMSLSGALVLVLIAVVALLLVRKCFGA